MAEAGVAGRAGFGARVAHHALRAATAAGGPELADERVAVDVLQGEDGEARVTKAGAQLRQADVEEPPVAGSDAETALQRTSRDRG